MSDKALLPCPFCGGDELSYGTSRPGVDGSAFTGEVQCHSCELVLWKDSLDEAIAAWNTRVQSTSPGGAEEWRPIETAPKDDIFIAAIPVCNLRTGEKWVERHLLWLDDETGDVHRDCEQGWSIADYDVWCRVPTPPASLGPSRMEDE